MSITFYYNPQSSAARVHLTLEELGVPYEKVLVDLAKKEQKKPEFLALNPNGKVPTIVIDGTAMFESIAIQIHLGERFGVERNLWPRVGSPEHMQALTWLCWAQVSFGMPLFRYVENTSEWIPAEMRHAGQAEAALAEVRECLRVLDERLGSRGNLVHADWTLADADVASVLAWSLHVSKLDISDYTHLRAWLDRAQARPAWRTVMAGAY
ncbi:MAG TPA: glutathione S-transferase family protein [Nannocystis sp.]